MEYRFWDKTYLSTYMLDTRLFDKYDFITLDATCQFDLYIY